MTEQNLRAIANGDTLQGKYPDGVSWDSLNTPYLRKFTTGTLLSQGLATNPTGTAIDFMGKKITYGELDTLIRKAATGLQKLGVEKGTKIGLYMPNTPYYPIMFMAALSIGATVVNYSPLYTEAELETQIKDSDTEIMVTLNLKDFFPKCESLHEKGVLSNIIKCDLEDMLPPLKATLFKLFKASDLAKPHDEYNHIKFNTLIERGINYRKPKFGADDVAVLQYTSGSTGTPKGVMLTHFNLVANAHQIANYFAKNEQTPEGAITMGRGNEKVLAAIPYFHVYGMMAAMLAPLQAGNEIVMIANPRDLPSVFKAIDSQKPTIAPLVPRLIQAMDESPKNAWQALRVALKPSTKAGLLKRVFNALTQYPLLRSFDISSIKAVVSGGAALPSATAKSFEKTVGRSDFILQGYGLSETSPFAASNPGFGKNKLVSVGMPCPGTEIKIADPNDPDKIMGIGEMGEICIRGPQVFKGYYKRPEETNKVLTKDGWFLTGDLGHLDEDMYIHITDRKKRIIIVNGENISPNQIEEKVTQHPAVADCVVIGLPDESAGEAAKIFIRFKNDITPPTEQELRSDLAKVLNRTEMPKFFEFTTEEFPMINNKTDWNALQKQEREKLTQQQSTQTPKLA